MQRIFFTFAVPVLATILPLTAFAGGDDPPPPASSPAPVTCSSGIPGGVNCVRTKKEIKEAHNAFVRGVKLEEHKELEEALAQFDEASRLVPQDFEFLSAREMVKAQLVFNHMAHGNALLAENSSAKAAAEFRAALELDPENEFARQQLAETNREAAPAMPKAMLFGFEERGELHLEPRKDLATFHYSGEVRGLYNELATAYGVTAQFDDSVQARQVRFNTQDVDFFTALKLAGQISKTMWSPIDEKHFFVAADTPENHKLYDRMSLQTFILPAHSTPQEATDLVTTMRNMFDLRFITSGQTSNTVEVRASPPILKACTELLEQLSNERPQVMLDVRVYQIDHQLTRNMGVHVPNTFNLYNIPAAALAGLAGLGGQSITDLVNQLISSGGINQTGSSAISGLLAQLGGGGNNIFSTPLATFGGGLTFEGLSLDQLAINLSLNESWVRSLEHMTTRAAQGNDATFHLGERYPILNASYAPVFNSPQISAVLGNQSYVPPFPSVSYEDLGLNVKVKPIVHEGSVSLTLEMQVRSLTGQSANGVPVISNREYKGSINLKDGEPAVVAGEVSKTDTISMSGIPGLGFLPLLNQTMVNNTKEQDEDELMIVITPHIISGAARNAPEIWVSEK